MEKSSENFYTNLDIKYFRTNLLEKPYKLYSECPDSEFENFSSPTCSKFAVECDWNKYFSNANKSGFFKQTCVFRKKHFFQNL